MSGGLNNPQYSIPTRVASAMFLNWKNTERLMAWEHKIIHTFRKIDTINPTSELVHQAYRIANKDVVNLPGFGCSIIPDWVKWELMIIKQNLFYNFNQSLGLLDSHLLNKRIPILTELRMTNNRWAQVIQPNSCWASQQSLRYIYLTAIYLSNTPRYSHSSRQI
jgi:hypothetical protein